MTSLERLTAESNLANVKAARLSNQLKVAQLEDAIERIKKDIQVSLDKEAEIEQKLATNN